MKIKMFLMLVIGYVTGGYGAHSARTEETLLSQGVAEHLLSVERQKNEEFLRRREEARLRIEGKVEWKERVTYPPRNLFSHSAVGNEGEQRGSDDVFKVGSGKKKDLKRKPSSSQFEEQRQVYLKREEGVYSELLAAGESNDVDGD